MNEVEVIRQLEKELIQAMKIGDVSTLDKLISEDLQFVTLGGFVLSKEDDLQNHRSGIFKVQSIEPSEQVIKTFDNIATVTVKVNLVASYDGLPISGTFRFGRTWVKTNETWRIITGLLTKISD